MEHVTAPIGGPGLVEQNSDSTLRQRKPTAAGKSKADEQVEEEVKEDSTFGKTPAGNGEYLLRAYVLIKTMIC